MSGITPETHLEKVVAGQVKAESHLEKVIAEYSGGDVYESLEAGVNITIEKTDEGKAKISASGEVSSEDTVARAEIADMKDGTTLDSFGDVETALADKVDAESGKGLSTNDFTDVLKTKLDGIASGAEVNVQSDWNQSDNTSDDYIKNKPTIPTAYTSTPAMDGTGSAGSSTSWAKGDHVHPSDTTKVDKVQGKELSTNDFTDELKTKLDGIAAGAEVNVQSDWNQSTVSADDYIKNKPLFNTAYNASTNKAATMSDITASAENGTLTGYTKKTGNVAATDKIVEAVGKLETKADDNKTNISTLMTPKKGVITWETGYEPTSENVSIRQYGNIVVGQIYATFANNLPTTETIIGTISVVDKTRMHYRGIGYTAPQLYNLPTDNVIVYINGNNGQIAITAGTNTNKTLRFNFVYCTSDPS